MKKYLSAHIVKAVKTGNIRAVKCFLKMHAHNQGLLNAHEKRKYGCSFYSASAWNWDTLPHLAVRYGKIEILRELAACDRISLTSPNRSFNSPLSLAIQYHNQEALAVLLTNLLVVNHITNTHSNETGLFLAAKLGNMGIVKTLLDHGADRDHKNSMGYTPEEECRLFGHTEIADFIKKYEPLADPKRQDEQPRPTVKP